LTLGMLIAFQLSVLLNDSSLGPITGLIEFASASASDRSSSSYCSTPFLYSASRDVQADATETPSSTDSPDLSWLFDLFVHIIELASLNRRPRP
jgi:hypothetical protein